MDVSIIAQPVHSPGVRLAQGRLDLVANHESLFNPVLEDPALANASSGFALLVSSSFALLNHSGEADGWF